MSWQTGININKANSCKELWWHCEGKVLPYVLVMKILLTIEKESSLDTRA